MDTRKLFLPLARMAAGKYFYELPDAIALIENDEAAAKKDAQWADLGCGAGLFTYALAHLLQKGGSIHAVDKSAVTLERHPNPHNINIYKKQLDFVQHPLPFQELDGILMANSLHFVANKTHFISNVSAHLAPDGCFLIVEYDTNKANPWVPYPASCAALQALFNKEGFFSFTKLHEIPSLYHTGNIYAAVIKK